MDLANTAVRWINLDSSSTKTSESVPTSSAVKTSKNAFSDNLATIHQGQMHADSGNTLPKKESQPETIEVRLLTTDAHQATLSSGKSSALLPTVDTANPQDSKTNISQTDLINEISAFNKGTQEQNASGAESDDSLTSLAGSINAKRNQHSESGDGSNTAPPAADLTFTPANSAKQPASDTGSAELETDSQTLQSVDSELTSAIKVEPTQNSLNASSTAVSLALSSETAIHPRLTNPISAEIQLVATQTMDKQASAASKSTSVALGSGSGQEFKLPNASSKQVPVKLVMIEAAATLQQWQKLKQANSDTVDSSPDATNTLLQPESRALRASPELQAARIVKTEQDAQALSQKFAEQLGQRLIQNVQKGHWRAELELHPKSLGRIDIQLDFVNGQLEGHFQSHNPLTRDLLQEGLPRLREWLQQTGTQVANLEVNNGNSGQGGEKPTPQRLSGRQNDAITDEPTVELASQASKTSTLKEGFDLLV